MVITTVTGATVLVSDLGRSNGCIFTKVEVSIKNSNNRKMTSVADARLNSADTPLRFFNPMIELF